jgi:hypothetical protein
LDIVGVFGRKFRDHGESLIHAVAVCLYYLWCLRGGLARSWVKLSLLDSLSEVR